MIKRSMIALVTPAALLVLLAVPAQASVVTAKQSGYTGYLEKSEFVTCSDQTDWAGTRVRTMGAPETRVTMAPQYPSDQQTVMGIQRIEWWTGSAWTGVWGSWKTGVPDWNYGNRTGLKTFVLPSDSFTVNAPGHYRIKTLYRWYRNGAQIGEVTNMYDFSSHLTWNVNPPTPVSVANLGTNVPTYCTFSK